MKHDARSNSMDRGPRTLRTLCCRTIHVAHAKEACTIRVPVPRPARSSQIEDAAATALYAMCNICAAARQIEPDRGRRRTPARPHVLHAACWSLVSTQHAGHWYPRSMLVTGIHAPHRVAPLCCDERSRAPPRYSGVNTERRPSGRYCGRLHGGGAWSCAAHSSPQTHKDVAAHTAGAALPSILGITVPY